MVTIQESKPSGFPADWNDSIEPGVTFHRDDLHFPYPLSPLFQTTMGPAFAAGRTTALQEGSSPVREVEVIHRNHYRFERFVMAEPASAEDAQLQEAVAEASLQHEIGRLLERWHSEHLPAIKAHLQRLQEMDPQNVTREELVSILDEVDTINLELWTIHFRTASPMLVALQLFDEFYADVFGGTESDAHALLVGELSETIQADIGLSDLAILARESGLASLFREMSIDAIIPALEASSPGRRFIARLYDYLEGYGLRQDLFDYTTPTWREDPSIALTNIRNHLLTGRDARTSHEAVARLANEALHATRERLALYPEAVREQFDEMLQSARHGAFLHEEHNYYIDQQGIALLRLFYLRVGQRLVDAGLLERADDVLMLKIDELREVIADPGASAHTRRVRGTVATRRDELSQARAMSPPSFIGDIPTGPPPAKNATQRARIKFFGGPPQQAEVPGQLMGNSGSKGVASGGARIARTLDDAQHLKPGEILVAVTTTPAWSPLFGVVAAVVTETGGALSHCAIVAREYGIPAVVGAHGATSTIATGQRVTVDGSRGIIILDA